MRIGYPYPYPVPVGKQFLDIRIRMQTHYPAGCPTGKPVSTKFLTSVKFLTYYCLSIILLLSVKE